MKTVVNELTGQVLYCFFEETVLAENEIIIDAIATGDFYDFEIQKFF
jgi:hypothetical protein